MNLYSIHDTKAETYSPPFTAHNHASAMRMFTMAVNDNNKDNMLFKYPEDHRLVHLGMWNPETGHIDSIAPQHQANGQDVKEQQ